MDIKVLVRSSKSGTVEVFTHYLEVADTEVISGHTNWAQGPVGVTSTYPDVGLNFTFISENDILSAYLLLTPGAITFMPYADLTGFDDGWVSGIVNALGEPILPSATAFQIAAADTSWSARFEHNLVDVLLSASSGAYPLTTYSYLIIDTEACASSKDLMYFFQWYYMSPSSSEVMELTGFSPVPLSIRDKVTTILGSVKCNGVDILQIDTAAYEARNSNI
jgi:ABC-type phosphate transport system substrate-binding protein